MSATAVEGPAEKAKGGKKKFVLIGAAVLVLAGVGAGGWFSGLIPKLIGGHEHASEASAGSAPVFMDVPEIVANLNSGARRATFIKLQAKLELARKEDVAIVEHAMPRVLDLFQGYLREMRPEELRGTGGTYRLREELVARTNVAAAPAKVTDVLFVELLVQ